MIDIFVINLEKRKDRLQHMGSQLSQYQWQVHKAFDGKQLSIRDFDRLGFRPDGRWKDPLVKRSLTNTEIGCFISHYRCWEHIANSNTSAIIFEDDAVLESSLPLEQIQQYLETYDILYLGYREMDKVSPIDDVLVSPSYPYLLSSYCISPRGARKLINTPIREHVIPADEYVPLMIGYDHNTNKDANSHLLRHAKIYKECEKLQAAAYRVPIAKQLSRSVMGSDIESGQIMSERTHVITVATDPSKATLLFSSGKRFGYNVNNLGEGVEWRGGTMQGPGGGQKINLVKQFLSGVQDDEVVLFVDGYDVFVADDLATVVERYRDMGADIVFAAEKACWPDKSLADQFPKVHTEYRYLNSGLYIGTARALKTILAKDILDHEDDQLYIQKEYLNPPSDVKMILDVENYIFQCVAFAKDEITLKKNKQLLNTATRCCPCILHGNGGKAEKIVFEKIAGQLGFHNTGIDFMLPGEVEVLGPDIIQLDFLTPEMCRRLIDMAEGHGEWQSMYGDKFPGQEIRLREFSIPLFQQLEQHFVDHLNKKIEKYWWPLQMYGVRDAFIIRYTPDTQKSLACHHDASLVSTITYLNSDYTGGDTYFYRQQFSTADVPVGKIVFWPGQVTHGHEGREVTSGTKYALVIWTSRRPGDINY